MKIAVFGASGRTGLELVFQALNQGHEVNAFTRKAGKVTITHKNIRILQGELSDAVKVRQAIEGCDVVMSTLGMDKNKKSTALSEGTAGILKAMELCGVKRLICMSSAGVLGNDGGFWFGRVIVPLFLRHVMEDKKRQVEVIRNSHAEWVIIRPSGLTDSPKTGRYRISQVRPSSWSIPRADVADFMLKLMAEKKYDFSLPAISSR